MSSRRILRTSHTLGLTLVAALALGCSDTPPTAPVSAQSASADGARSSVEAPPPIASEPLTGRHRFTDDVAMQVRVKPDGMPTSTVNLKDASNIAVVRFTIQPGVRFPWHSHPGTVLVSVTQGDLVFVYANDCVRRPYATGTAFVDPGFGNVHYAYNPTDHETVIVATFLGVPPAPAPLTNAVDAATSAELDAKCSVAPATAQHH